MIGIMAANIVFLSGYLFYLKYFLPLLTGSQFHPVFLVPVAVYSVLAVFLFFLRVITREKIAVILAGLTPALFAFAIIFLVPMIKNISLPDPHNFLLRKTEILMGAAYTAYLFILAIILFLHVRKKIFEQLPDVKQVFLYVASFFFIFYFSLSLWFNYANQPTGDEPSYILVAHSMIYDRDIDMKNNYENADYKKFYSRDLKPQGDGLSVNGKMYPKHPAAFSAVIAPFYLIAGVTGISALMSFFSALLAAVLFYISFRMTNDMPASVTVSALAGLTLPVLASINLASTDILCALILAASYAIYRYKPEKTILLSVIMAAAVWIHLRIVPVYGIIALLYIIKQRERPGNLIKFCMIQAVSFLAFFGINYYFYGEIIPYGSHQTGGIILGSYTLRGLFVYFFDRQLGLFSYTPFYILSISGLYLMWNRQRQDTLALAAIFMPYYLLIASYLDWGWGSSSPRYLLPVIFIPVAAVAAAVSAIRKMFQKRLFYALALASLGLSFIVSVVPWFRWDKAGHENWMIFLISKLSGLDLRLVFPSLINMDKSTLFSLLFWVLFVSAVSIKFIIETGATEGNKDTVRK